MPENRLNYGETVLNSVTKEHIDRLLDASETQEHVFWGKELIVSYRLPNGFTIAGRAACVDPTNFDLEKGRAIARKDAERQLWELEGYLLQHRIAGTAAMSLGELVARSFDNEKTNLSEIEKRKLFEVKIGGVAGRVQTGENSFVEMTSTPSETIEAIFQKEGEKIFLVPSPAKDVVSRSGALIGNSFSIAQYNPAWNQINPIDNVKRSQRYRVTIMDSFKPLGECTVLNAEAIDE